MTIFALTAKPLKSSSHFGSIIRPHVRAVLCHHWFCAPDICWTRPRHAPSISSETVWYRCINCDDVCSFSCYDHLHQSWAKTLLEYVGISYLLGKQFFKTRSIMSFFAPISGKSPASMKNIEKKKMVGDLSRRTLPGHFDPFFDLGGSPMHGKQLQKRIFRRSKEDICTQ